MTTRTLDFVYSSRKTALRGAQRAAEPGWEAGVPIPTEGGWLAVLVAKHPAAPAKVGVVLAWAPGSASEFLVIRPTPRFAGLGIYAVRRANGAVRTRAIDTAAGFGSDVIGRVIGHGVAYDTDAVTAVAIGQRAVL